ncbi:hypothetical protein WMY93_000103 [Mugilogobius chulae]|uniref:Uncharacterized protein n=1 Tax=Mugilogobius chulae TaxID=88201 RepID=A0AAW0Q872_9GOBI
MKDDAILLMHYDEPWRWLWNFSGSSCRSTWGHLGLLFRWDTMSSSLCARTLHDAGTDCPKGRILFPPELCMSDVGCSDRTTAESFSKALGTDGTCGHKHRGERGRATKLDQDVLTLKRTAHEAVKHSEERFKSFVRELESVHTNVTNQIRSLQEREEAKIKQIHDRLQHGDHRADQEQTP